MIGILRLETESRGEPTGNPCVVRVSVADRAHKAEGGRIILHLRTKQGVLPIPIPHFVPGNIFLTVPLVPMTLPRGGEDCPSKHLDFGLDEELVLTLDELVLAVRNID